MACIYKIESPKGKIYIGQSRNFIYRLFQYKSNRIPNQRVLHNSIIAHGWTSHKIEIVIELPKDVSDITLNEYERFVWAQFKDSGHKMMNIKEPGNQPKQSEETKIKIGLSNSIKLKGRKLSSTHVESIRNALKHNKYRLGSVHSFETRIKMRDKRIGKTNSCVTRKKISDSKKKTIIQLDMNGVFIRQYACAKEAVNDKFISDKHIRNCASGVKNTAYGFKWSYKY